MKLSRIITIILSILGGVVLIASVIMLNDSTESKSAGTVIVEYVGLDGEVIKSKNIEYYEGDTLEGLVKANFDNVTMDGTMIMTIEDYTTPSDWSTFISINVNDVQSNFGIREISLEDGLKVSLIITEFIYE